MGGKYEVLNGKGGPYGVFNTPAREGTKRPAIELRIGPTTGKENREKTGRPSRIQGAKGPAAGRGKGRKTKWGGRENPPPPPPTLLRSVQERGGSQKKRIKKCDVIVINGFTLFTPPGGDGTWHRESLWQVFERDQSWKSRLTGPLGVSLPGTLAARP